MNMAVLGCIGRGMQSNTTLHEKLHRVETTKIGPDRIFGLLFSFIFSIIGIFPLWSGGAVLIWALAVALGIAFIAMIAPRLLHPLNIVWCRFGHLLHMVITPLIMGVIFFLVFTPLSLVFRVFGRDALSCELDPDAATYWVERPPSEPAPDSMRNQF